MCGIAGAAWNAPDGRVPRGTLDQMTDILRHRGPDGRGVHWEQLETGQGVALGHRRLAIRDVERGQQPLANEDDSIWITFNGEIYNDRELRSMLQGRGHRFRTATDTEVLVHLYEEYGVECVTHLRGMFAFAIWDRPRRRLLLVRDRLGQKPLVYRHANGRVLFASEIKAILQVPGVSRIVDPLALDEYLTLGYVPHPRTMFDGIAKLPPGHRALFENGQLDVQSYWSPDYQATSSLSSQQLERKLRDTLNESVQLRLRSDVPVAAFLSGGVDSTVIAGLMQRNHDTPTQTVSLGFPVAEFDETSFAQTAADHLGTDHRAFQVDPASIDLLPRLVWHFDEPFGDSSALPAYQLAQVTSQQVKVALTGDGGDELFAGYDRYRTFDRLGALDRLPAFCRQALGQLFHDTASSVGNEQSIRRRFAFRMQMLSESPAARYRHWVTTWHDAQRASLYTDAFAERLRGSDPSRLVTDAMNRTLGRSPGDRARLTDLQTYLPCDLLAKVDITSMAHGLECRSPMLDHRVVELAAAVSFRELTRGRENKGLLTRTFRDLLPRSLRKRSKMGFRVPLDHWFRTTSREFARETLMSSTSQSRGIFSRSAVRQLLDDHDSGRWNHGERIWQLLCLESWYQTFLDASEPPARPCADTLARTNTGQGPMLLRPHDAGKNRSTVPAPLARRILVGSDPRDPSHA